MMCLKCHRGLPLSAYPKPGERYWNEAMVRFVAKHEPHNRKWAHGWRIALSRAALIAFKYGGEEDVKEGYRLVKLYTDAFHEDIIRGLKA